MSNQRGSLRDKLRVCCLKSLVLAPAAPAVGVPVNAGAVQRRFGLYSNLYNGFTAFWCGCQRFAVTVRALLNLTIPFRQAGIFRGNHVRDVFCPFCGIFALVVAARQQYCFAPPVMRWYQMRRRDWMPDADDEAAVALAAAVLADVAAAFVSDILLRLPMRLPPFPTCCRRSG